MTRARLLILSYSPIHSDARVLKQVALFRDRYDVTTCGYGPAPAGVVDHVEIPAGLLAWRLDRRLVVARRYREALRTQEVNAHLVGRLPRDHFDVVLADDLDSVPLALTLRPRGGVHADLHEYGPKQKDSWRFRVFVAPYLRWVVRNFANRAASVSTVGQGLADEYRREFGLEASVVTNATPFHDLKPSEVHEPLALVHSGAALPERHLEIMIDAMAQLTRPATLDLYLTRNDPAYIDRLRERAASSGRVRILDPVPYRDLVRTLQRYDVGVFVLPPVSFSYRWTLPNKLFDFLQARLAVVVSPSPEMARLVTRHSFGFVTEDFSSAALARVLESLTPEAVAQAKRAADVAARELAAENQMGPWQEAVDRLAERAARRGEAGS